MGRKKNRVTVTTVTEVSHKRRAGLSVEDYKALGQAALHDEIVRMLSRLNAAKRRIAIEKKNLLLALTAMRDLTAHPGGHRMGSKSEYQRELESFGLTPELVRQWRSRSGTDEDLKAVLRQKTTAKKSTRRTDSGTMSTVRRLCDAVLAGDAVLAEKLAMTIASRQGFGLVGGA